MVTTFTGLLAEQRRRRDLTLIEAADAMGISRTNYYWLETGRCRNPSIRTLRAIADAYEVPLGRLAEIASRGERKQ